MTLYLTLKWLHIISSVLLVGTGFGSAFYLYFIHRTGNQQAITHIINLVVRADHWFTLPTIISQPLTGCAMIYLAGYPVSGLWITSSLALYLLTGICWVPVFFLQLRMRAIANQALLENAPLPVIYWHYAKYWQRLGYPAFLAMLFIFWLMVFKPT